MKMHMPGKRWYVMYTLKKWYVALRMWSFRGEQGLVSMKLSLIAVQLHALALMAGIIHAATSSYPIRMHLSLNI